MQKPRLRSSDCLVASIAPGTVTRSVSKFGDKQCLGWRPIQDGKPQPFTWMTYKEVPYRLPCAAG